MAHTLLRCRRPAARAPREEGWFLLVGWVEELPSGRFRGIARNPVTGKRISKTHDRWSQADAWWRREEDEMDGDYCDSVAGVSDMEISSADPAYDFIVKMLAQLEDFGLDANDLGTVRRAVLQGRAVHRLVARVQRQGTAARPLVPPKGVELVYYIRIGNRCKIGYTANMPNRMISLNPEEILATEPGYPALERARHEEFAHLRTNGEWFRLEEPLTSHIDLLRVGTGQPPLPRPHVGTTP